MQVQLRTYTYCTTLYHLNTVLYAVKYTILYTLLMCSGKVGPCFFHATSYPLSCGPEDSTELSSFLNKFDLRGQSMT